MAELKNSSFYSYFIASACFGIQAVGIGTNVAYGVFINPLITEFGWSRAAVSGAYSAAFFLMGFFGIFVGGLIDKMGPRIVMTVTGIFFGLGHLLMFRLDAVWQLYLFYGVIVGIGLSALDVITLSTTARWFSKNRGIMTGIVKIGTGAGQLTIPLVASILIINYGWRTSYLILGIGGLLLLVSIAQLLRFPPRQLDPLTYHEKEPLVLKNYSADEGLSPGETFRTGQFWTICGVAFSVMFCFLVIIVHIVPHAQDTGIYSTKAASVLSVIGGVSMIGRFIVGVAIDRIGSKRAMILCFILLTAGLLWLQTAEELWMLYLFAVIYGIAHGGFFTAVSPIVAEFFGIGAHGLLFGIVFFSGTFGGSVGPILAGYIFDVTAQYSLALWICVFMSVLGLGLLLSLKPLRERAPG